MEGINYIIDDDNRVIDLSTGEVIDIDKIIKLKNNKLINDFNNGRLESLQMGDMEDIRIVKYKGVTHPCVTIKNNYTFGKVFRVEVRNLMEEGKLSLNARGFIATFEPYISFPANSIIVNSKHPNQETYEKMLGLKKSALYKIFNELEYYGVIKRIKLNGENIVYFNPFLYCCGGIVHKDTYKLFADSVYNPLNK